jgi:hypothetical protein
MGRWVCLRCYESNDAALVSCAKCGLTRGEAPDAADPATAQALPQQPAHGSALGGLVRRFGWVAVVAVVAGVGWWFSAGRGDTGEITRSGSMSVTDLRTGDCFDLKDPEAEFIEEVDAKVCTEPHEYEMIFVGDMPSGGYPSLDQMDEFALANCIPAFEAYVGLSFDDSRYYLTHVTPTEDGWNDGDHAIQCAAYDPDNQELTATVRGANQ